MFGYIQADRTRLDEEQAARYRAVYCGLCRTLRREYGAISRLALTYDMTFLAMLLASLYEPDEQSGQERCAPHPLRPHEYAQTEFSSYAAAMNVLLAREACLDGWHDDRNAAKYLAAQGLTRAAERAAVRYGAQENAIREGLSQLAEVEAHGKCEPDAAANAFGAILSSLFAPREDRWQPVLQEFGMALGRFVYLLDAVCDHTADRRRGRYNPLPNELMTGARPMHGELTLLIGDAASAFERLPLVQDAALLRNILYFGVWAQYDRQFPREGKEETP